MILVTIPHFPAEWYSWPWPDSMGIMAREPADVEVWITDPHVPIDEDGLDRFPNLKLVITASTGDNHIDRKALKERNIGFRSLLDRKDDLERITGSAEFCFFLLLAALRNGKRAFRDARLWDEAHSDLRGSELHGKKVGIIGYGRIGRLMFKYCTAFGAEVRDIYDAYHPYATLEKLFQRSDIVIISCTLNDKTEKMIDERLLMMMRPCAVLVNVARGEVIDENALARVLVKRPDLHAAVDVLAGEVNGAHLASPLFDLKNATVTPHLAGITYEANEKAARIALDLVREWYGDKTQESL